VDVAIECPHDSSGKGIACVLRHTPRRIAFLLVFFFFQAEDGIRDRNVTILPVHYAGHPVDLDAIHDAARGVGAAVIEDAAHALPARYKSRWIGSGPNPVAFSFYATKNLTTGEGGMLTGAPDFLDRARVLSLHGMSRDAWKRYGKGGSW